MAKLSILRYPDPRLHTVAKPVATVDARIRQLVDDMLETMYAAEGVGLAATQVDVHERVIVIDTSANLNEPHVLINPELTRRSVEMTFTDEGCLSVPAIFDKVQRHAEVTVRSLGRDGKPAELQASGLLAVCIQHEMDHLDGTLFVDHISSLRRGMILKRLQKFKKIKAAERAEQKSA